MTTRFCIRNKNLVNEGDRMDRFNSIQEWTAIYFIPWIERTDCFSIYGKFQKVKVLDLKIGR
jgi:hypothetical protein